MDRTEFSELQPLQAMSLVWCTLSCIHHFYIRLRVNSGGILAWARRSVNCNLTRSFSAPKT